MNVECGVHCHAGRHVRHDQTLELSSEVTTELQQRHSHHEPLDPEEAAISHTHFADPASAQCNTFTTP